MATTLKSTILELFIWEKEYPAQKDPNQKAFFLVTRVSQEEVDSIKFGDEGQRWDFMDYHTFFESPDVVEALKGRFRDYLDKK
jgi:8-oxo-dGTP diphosphatase